MASVEWTKLSRDIHGLYLALRGSIVMAATSRRPRRTGLGARRGKFKGGRSMDLAMLAEFERRKALAYLGNARNQLR